MSQAIKNLVDAQQFAMSIRPKVGGFPYLAEALRLAGVTSNIWHLPSCQSLYVTKLGKVMNQGTPLLNGMAEVPQFDREALVRALRTDQEGRSTFSEFLQSVWGAGVVKYDVDFEKRQCIYFGVKGEAYVEVYPAVDLKR